MVGLKVKSIGTQTSTKWSSVIVNVMAVKYICIYIYISQNFLYCNNPSLTVPQGHCGSPESSDTGPALFPVCATDSWRLRCYGKSEGETEVQRVQHKRLLLYWNLPDPVPSLPHTHSKHSVALER